MTCGIYKITNNINNKVYIGQSRTIEKRWIKHKNASNNPNDHNYDTPLHRAFRKYGVNNFKFEIIEECSIDKLDEREIYWINYYDSFTKGYNLTLGGDGSGYAINKNKVIGIIDDLTNSLLFQKEIAEKWGCSEEMVQGINTGRYWYQSSVTYPRRQFKISRSEPRIALPLDYKQQNYCIDCGKPIDRKATRCIECARKAQQKVPRPSKEELYKDLKANPNFTQIAKQYGVTDNAVRKWCKGYGLPTHTKDYK